MSARPDAAHGRGAHDDHGAGGAHGEDAGAYWESHYRDRSRAWSGRANALLVEEVEDARPGRALDLGCGSGGDAIWLAQHGWRVTAVDVSATAIAQGREAAEAAGVADRIAWERHDLADSLPEGPFDLVSACYLHSPLAFPRFDVLRRAAATVAAGGQLLVVGHAGPPSFARADPRFGAGHDLPGAAETRERLALPEDAWVTESARDVERPVTRPNDPPGTRPDCALRLRRAG